MESGGSETKILRRIKRKSVGHWVWNAYNPMSSRGNSKEDVFVVLDERGRITGQMSFGRMRMKKGVEIETPWGPARIVWPGMKLTIILNGKELVRLDMSWFGKKTDFVFGDGVIMQFHSVKGSRTDIKYTDEKGYVSFNQETGTLPEGHPGIGVQLTKEDIRRMPKKERPRSITTRDYIQYRMVVGGELPELKDNLFAALAIFAGFMQLLDELPRPARWRDD